MDALSIRARLVLGMVLLLATGLLVANVAGIVLLRSYLLDRVDTQVSGLGGMPAQDPPPGVPDTTAQGCANPRDPRGLRSDFLLLVLDADGQVACSLGPELGGSAPELSRLRDVAGSTTLRDVPSQDGESQWRVRSVELAGADTTLVFAVSLADVDATVNRMIGLSALISGAILLLVAAAAWVLARIGLRPLERIEETAEHIAAGDLSERVPTYRSGTEIGRLARALNGMLAQIEDAFTARTRSEERLRRFVSDASHELRTPIATIRGHAEMWRTGVTHDLDTVMERIESESTRMGDLVSDMLLLARLDQSRPLEQEPVDMLSLATEAVLDAQALQPERSLTVEAHPGRRPPVVLGDEARLRQVLTNLLTNALVHTPATSPVAVAVRVSEGRVVVTVRDEGPGMPAEALSAVFDRFYRADPSRSRDQGGSGLGLAIVKSLVEAHHGTVTCTSDVTSGSAFGVSLPMA
ncbi:HAMP domain-containing sensor histidine kinase [Nocardioides sp. 1609]|uniref:sensor histidine kinase n=1 Tax=Nocardioides sp. 1609 TaxID=2508327 RepID=UPI00106F5A3E|nr:HAMP domain-containing sensor histidine kinase [Nocardioides sp. 1609]